MTIETKSRITASGITLAYKQAVTEAIVRPDLKWLMASLRDRSALPAADALTAIVGCAVDLARDELVRLPEADLALCRVNLMAFIDLFVRRELPAP